MSLFDEYEYQMIKSTKIAFFFTGMIAGALLMGLFSFWIIFSTPRYEVSQYEGMTCINHENGLTCNWDEWKGEAR